jgi:formylglycine-generating enzyme required for sulfatase activity
MDLGGAVYRPRFFGFTISLTEKTYIMRIAILLISLVLPGSPVLITAQRKPEPVAPSKPAAAKPKPPAAVVKEPEAYAYLLVNSDLDVNITVNYGKTYRVSSTDDGKRVPLEAGDNLIKITPLDGGSDGYTETITMDKKGNRVYSVKLKAARDAEEAKKKEEEVKKKEEEAKKNAEAEAKKNAEAEAKKNAEAEAKKNAEAEAKMPSRLNDPLAGTFILVKGGTFTMGCTSEQSDCSSDERPAHQVTLSNYYIGETEVTQAQWRSVMGSNPSRFSGCDACPVEQVSWNDVQEFISRLNNLSGGARYRLPTEAEWEYAARGGSQSRNYQYAGSNYLDEVAWSNSNSGGKTHAVKGKKSNELGLYDMSGNVREWCSDWYGSYSSGSQTNPVGASSGSSRVDRGGSWGLGAPASCRVADRAGITPGHRGNALGFRLARTP